MLIRNLLVASFVVLFAAPHAGAEDLDLQLRYQEETRPGAGRFHRLVREETWAPEETALIVCDVWDLHHCLNAVRRVEEFGPRLAKVIDEARRRGVTIIHAPSDCMAAYEDHPARRRAQQTPKADNLPADITAWCSRIPSEEKGIYPIDQSDGGEDDDPEDHAEWAAKLKAMGRNPATPWKRQSDLIPIDGERDYISDRGDEVWSILEERGVENVILTGVHTNMCVLGRPFGLRQMARNGKNVVLMRDMTDTMYNPQRWPSVSHFSGTDLIVSHIEKYVCPTITSDQLIGGAPFRFAIDKRPHLAIVIAEDEYKTEETLPVFAQQYLDKNFRVSYVFGSETERNTLPGLVEALHDADALLISVRRRLLPPPQMKAIKAFVAAGKPVIGLRTASHAFSLRGNEAPEGLVAWPAWDAQVLGGNYTGHHGNKLTSQVRIAPGAADHPILKGIPREPFQQGGSLYKTSPLAEETTALLLGQIEGQPEEPAAWTFQREDGGRSFYTSLGHVGDFGNPPFQRLLLNGIHWAAGLPIRDDVSTAGRTDYEQHWSLLPVPASWEAASAGVLEDYDGIGWYRCVVRLPEQWLSGKQLTLKLPSDEDSLTAWMNGATLEAKSNNGNDFIAIIPADAVIPDDYNLLVIRVEDRGGPGGLQQTPLLSAGDEQLTLAGPWQFRLGDDRSWSNMPLPARFGASTDVIFEP